MDTNTDTIDFGNMGTVALLPVAVVGLLWLMMALVAAAVAPQGRRLVFFFCTALFLGPRWQPRRSAASVVIRCHYMELTRSAGPCSRLFKSRVLYKFIRPHRPPFRRLRHRRRQLQVHRLVGITPKARESRPVGGTAIPGIDTKCGGGICWTNSESDLVVNSAAVCRIR